MASPIYTSLATALLALTAAGCGHNEQPPATTGSSATTKTSDTRAEPRVVDLYVADQTQPCRVGPKPRDCLQLRWDPNKPWELSWNDTASIAGFQYRPGYIYHLRVEKTPLPYPPPDAPQYELRLVEVVAQNPV